MKKNLIIAFLSVSLIVSVSFGTYQTIRANENEILAVLNEKLAKEMAIKAEQQMRRAEEQMHIAAANAMQAMRQADIANEQLLKSKKLR